jgi:hypothetical protein
MKTEIIKWDQLPVYDDPIKECVNALISEVKYQGWLNSFVLGIPIGERRALIRMKVDAFHKVKANLESIIESKSFLNAKDRVIITNTYYKFAVVNG